MHRQASFYAANWPEGTKVGPDGDVCAFYLPAVDDSTPSRSSVVASSSPPSPTVPRSRPSRPTSSSVEWANERAKTCGSGGWVTANKNADPNLLTNPIDKLSAEILTDKAATFRFDGSDLMPGAVGAGTFWKGMTNWITGQDDKATLDYIENSWPKS